jgi:hypothetical protein
MPRPVIGCAAAAAARIASIRSRDFFARPRPFLELVSEYSVVRFMPPPFDALEPCKFAQRLSTIPDEPGMSAGKQDKPALGVALALDPGPQQRNDMDIIALTRGVG